MGDRLTGKTALVTAAGAGIGRATALAFAGEGAAVWATDINDEALASLAAEEPGLTTRHLDATDGTAIAELAKELGTIDVLFNCAGMVPYGNILVCDEDTWDRTLSLNVTSMYRTIRAFLPAMLEAGGGSIINVSSVVSSVKGAPNRLAYGTSKAAVIGLTKGVAVDFVTQGIRCNVICPGTVHTPSIQDRIDAAPDPKQARKEFIARQPMGRLAEAREIAALVVYLATEEAGFTTGAIHLIDGGWSM